MQAQQMYCHGQGVWLPAADSMTRTSSCSTESDFTSFSTNSESPVKAVTPASLHSGSSGSSSSSSKARHSIGTSFWRRARSIGALMSFQATESDAACIITTPGHEDKVPGTTAAAASNTATQYEPPKASNTSSMFSSPVIHSNNHAGQMQPHFSHQCQGHGYQQLLPAHHAAQQQQQQQQQHLLHSKIACQQVHVAAYQQLHMQQLQLMPCMLPAAALCGITVASPTQQPSCCYSNSYQQCCQPVNNMEHCGSVVPHVAPCSNSNCCLVAHCLSEAAVASQAGSCCRSSSSTTWGVAHSTAGMLLQQVAYQPPLQPQGLRMPVAHIAAAHNQALQQQQQQQQHWGSPLVHALASALLHILLTLVALVLRMHKGVQAAVSRAAAAQGQCVHFVHQQMQLVSCAAAQAAAAEGVEELWLLLQQSHSSSSSNSSGDSSTTTAVMAIEQQLLLQQQAGNSPTTICTVAHQPADYTRQMHPQQQQQQETASVGSCARLLVVLGLWAGVVWWACRWLLLQAPAATGNAVASTYQQGASAAEHAALLAVEYLLRVCYGVAWAVAKQMHRVTARATQAALVHGTAAAQQVCCVVLWVVGFAHGDSQQQRSQLQQLLVQVLRSAGAAAGRCGCWGMSSAEVVAAAVAAKLLRDASPVTQTAVWGLAGMLKRNVVESSSLCWQLLLQLSQLYMAQQQQQQQQPLRRQQQGQRRHVMH